MSTNNAQLQQIHIAAGIANKAKRELRMAEEELRMAQEKAKEELRMAEKKAKEELRMAEEKAKVELDLKEQIVESKSSFYNIKMVELKSITSKMKKPLNYTKNGKNGTNNNTRRNNKSKKNRNGN
jgi:hypothetical protein